MNRKLREQLAGYVDGELSDVQRAAFEEELAADPELQAELDEFRRLKKVTDMMHYADLPDTVWDSYWESLYRKMERGIGWIFLSLGAIILICFGLYEALGELFTSPDNPLWLKFGVTGVGVGVIILLVSYVRERLFAYNRDRYREITK